MGVSETESFVQSTTSPEGPQKVLLLQNNVLLRRDAGYTDGNYCENNSFSVYLS